jgi:hypothetical protein
VTGYTVVCDGTDRAQWLEKRRDGVTATDIARLARGGTNTWAAVHAEKAGKERHFSNSAMEHGKNREPVIARFAQSMYGLYHSTALLSWNTEGRFLATPDLRGAGKHKVGDIKTTVHDWRTLDEVPGRYIDQLLWQMLVVGEKHAALIFEPHENGIPLYPTPQLLVVDWDSARVAKLQATAYEFLAEDGTPDEDAAILDALLTDAAMRKELADAAAKSYASADAAIEEYLEGKPRRFDGSLAALTRSADGISTSIDTTRLKRDRPDVAAEFTRTSPRKGALRITLHTDNDEQTGAAA